MNAIYIRTSTQEQNPENQLQQCLEMCKENYELYQDQQSAWKENVERPNFNKLKSDIKLNRVGNLYVWDLDRIFRNRANLLGFFNFCKAHKCTVWSSRQKFLNEMQSIELPKGFEFIKEMMIDNFLQFLGWIAEDESQKKSDRVRAAIRSKPDGAYSYKGNKWGRKRISTFKKNQITELKRKGLSLRSIAAELGVSKSVVHKYLQEIKQ